jgi:hypothetical protein
LVACLHGRRLIIIVKCRIYVGKLNYPFGRLKKV